MNKEIKIILENYEYLIINILKIIVGIIAFFTMSIIVSKNNSSFKFILSVLLFLLEIHIFGILNENN